MKKFVLKNISVILSLALVLGVVFPCFSGVVASAYTTENAAYKTQIDTACETLISEWKKLAGEEELPFGVEEMSPYELFDEAQNFDLSGFDNVSNFVAAKETLATLLTNSFDPTALKNAWHKVNKSVAIDHLTPYGIINGDVDKNDGAYEDAVYFREGTEGITINHNKADDAELFGNKSVEFDFAVGKNRTTMNAGDNQYTVFISNDADTIKDEDLINSFGTTKHLHGASDMQFSFVINKINTAATNTRIGFRVTGIYNGGFGVRATRIYINVNEDMIGKVNTIKFSDLALSAGMTDWEENFTKGTGRIARIEMQLFDDDSEENASVNMTLGSAISIKYRDVPSDEETANWNVADWINAAKSVDISGCKETEAFLNEIKKAEELRDISGIEVSSTVTTHLNTTSVDISRYGDNLLKGIVPTINYYDGVSDVKEPRFTVDYDLITDGPITNGAKIEDVDFSNDGSFVEFIYDIKKINGIEKIAVVSSTENALRFYKYKIYAAKTEGELFTTESLINTYVNRDASAAQIFDHSKEPIVAARYIAIRIYIPAIDMNAFDGSLNINKLGVWGYEMNYSVDKSVFSASKIENFGTNLLTVGGVNRFVRANTGNRQRFTGLFDEEVYPFENVVDNDNTTAIGVSGNYRMRKSGDTTSLHIYFDLGKVYAINKFLFASLTTLYQQVGKYKIHASNDVNALFTDDSVVVDYDNTVDTSDTQIFNMKTDVIARYVSFHITVPVADYDALIAKYGEGYTGAAIRISELGVYGKEYKRTSKKQNVLAHVPVEINRIDENGNKTAVADSEYSGENHTLTYDGNYDETVKVAANGKKIEFVYNLYDDANVESLRVVTGSKNVTEMKFYASTALSAVDDESALVYSYDAATDGEKNIFNKNFVTAPAKISYFRIVVTVTGDFDPTEIEAIGWDSGRDEYRNLALNNSGYTSYMISDIKDKSYTKTASDMDKWLPAWSSAEEYHYYSYAFDGDLGTIYTYYGGQNNSKAVNIYINLQTACSVDDISIYTSLLEDYRPSKMNVYVGNSLDELFAADAVPVKQWTEKILNDQTVIEEDNFGADDGEFGDDDPVIDFGSGELLSPGTPSEEDETIVETTEKTPAQMGLYRAQFVARTATSIRIEIIESNPEYFAHKNKVGGIITEIMINGFELSESMADGVIDAADEMTMRAFEPTVYHDNTDGTRKTPMAYGSVNNEQVVLVKGIGQNVAHSPCDSGSGYVEFNSTSDLTDVVTLADIEDIYFSYKINKALSGGEVAARIYIFDKDGRYAHNFAVTGTDTVLFVPTSNTEWVHTSMSEVTGENWKESVVSSFNAVYGKTDNNAFTEEDISINKIRLGFNTAAQADMSFSSMYYEFNEGCNPYSEVITKTLGKNNQEVALSPTHYYSNKRHSTSIISGEYTGDYVELKGVGAEIGNSSCSSFGGYVEWNATANSKEVTLADIENIYFSYKVDKAISGATANARMYIYDQNSNYAYGFASKGTSTVIYLDLNNTEWTKTSIRDIVGGDWKERLVASYSEDYGEEKKAEDITISKIRFGFNFVGAGDISFSAMYYEYDDISSASTARANEILSVACGIIDPATASRETAREYKYSVGLLAEYLGADPVNDYCLSGDYKSTAPSMRDLALLAQYLDGDLSGDDYIDLNCADINKDGVISEADVTVLRKTLMR